MILVDTSIWIDHFRVANLALARLLHGGRVAMHVMVIGELACGSIPQRSEILLRLRRLPQAPLALHDEVLFFIERHQIMSLGIGYIDVHLLAAASMSPELKLWTRDRRLSAIAGQLGLQHTQ